MKKQTAQQIHELVNIILGDGAWDREIQMSVDEGVLTMAKAEGEQEALDALELLDKVNALNDDGGEKAAKEVEAIRADARALAESMGFGLEEGTDPATLLPFDTSAYCPTCSYHMDDHDMRQMNAGGTVGECPVPTDAPATKAAAHTPGPWAIAQADGAPIIHQAGEDSAAYQPSSICQVFRYGGTRPTDANARLIAAAPDLLAALEAIAWKADDGHFDYRACARAAILRATKGR